jgi:hypothetical protein
VSYRKKRHPHRNHNPTGNVKPLTTSTVEKLLYGAPLPDIHTEKRLAESRKEIHAMPSLQEALQTAVQRQQHAALTQIIDAWEDDEPLPQLQPQPQEKQAMKNPPLNITTNVSRATFYFIRANPGLTKEEICKRLVDEGYKASSVTSLISQLRRTSQIEPRDDKYYALMNDYVPINQVATRAMRKHKQQKAAAKSAPKSEGIAALHPVATPAPTPAPAPAYAPVVIPNEIEHILNTLPIKQARALYDELHKVFGNK